MPDQPAAIGVFAEPLEHRAGSVSARVGSTAGAGVEGGDAGRARAGRLSALPRQPGKRGADRRRAQAAAGLAVLASACGPADRVGSEAWRSASSSCVACAGPPRVDPMSCGVSRGTPASGACGPRRPAPAGGRRGRAGGQARQRARSASSVMGRIPARIGSRRSEMPTPDLPVAVTENRDTGLMGGRAKGRAAYSGCRRPSATSASVELGSRGERDRPV